MQSKTISNASWLIGCRLIQAFFGLVVTMMSARFLGPSGYGIVNYAASIVAFFVPIMQLGLNATLVHEVINGPEHEGQTLGTALTLTFISSLACIIGVVTFVMIANNGETETIIVCLLYSLLLVFQSIEMIQYWFQAKLLSKYTAVTVLIAYIIVSAYRIILLVKKVSIYLYAISQAIDFAIIAIVLIIIYAKLSRQKLTFSFERAKRMLNRSKHYILSALMITLFTQTDRVMLKLLINEESVGLYSAAATCTSLTAFVFVAIIDSARPGILESQKKSFDTFFEKMKLLYAIVIFLALAQSLVITLFSRFIIEIMYGQEYHASINTLRIMTWYTTFSYIGAVRDVWILAKGKQSLLWIINISGAVVNVLLNLLLIPVLGINGAALATLFTQVFANIIIGWLLPQLRHTNEIMISALNPAFLIRGVKDLFRK